MRTRTFFTLGLLISLMGTLAAPAQAVARWSRRSRLPRIVILGAIALGPFVGQAQQAEAALTGGPFIIPAPASVENLSPPGSGALHQQAFNERQGVTLPANLAVDGGSIPAGTQVNSHMIFFNRPDNLTTGIGDQGRVWTFDGAIVGVMSDQGGLLEAASNALLGAPGTTYPGAFANRGLEGNNGTGLGPGDGYLVAGNSIRVGMAISQPGDWIRVVTVAPGPKTNPARVVGEGSVNTPLGPMIFEVSISRTTVGGPISGGLAKAILRNETAMFSTKITDLVVLDPNRVLVKGQCVIVPFLNADSLSLQGNNLVEDGCTFTAIITDGRRAEGRGDFFEISTHGGPSLGGPLTSGDVFVTT